MEFTSAQPIFLQIVDHLCERILQDDFSSDEKLPSVRVLAAELLVNPNTVARAMEFLQTEAIIESKRGIGLFVTNQGKKNASHYLTQKFNDHLIPIIRNYMQMLSLSDQDLLGLLSNTKNLTQ